MSEEAFLKCACSFCQGHLEFPAYAAGITTTCPHCGVETTLIAPESVAVLPSAALPPPPPPPPPPSAARTPLPVAVSPVATPAGVVVDTSPAPAGTAGAKLKKILSVVWSVLVAIVVIGVIGLKVWKKYRKVGQAVETVKGGSKPEKTKSPSEAPASAPRPVPMPAPVTVPTSVVVAKGTPPARKPGEDLQVLDFEIQKARDGNLQYIVGVVTNHSGRQLFNVKLAFELTRKDGRTGDVATDSIRNLAANAGATFKASIIGTAPVAGAKLAKLEGEKE